MRHRHLTQDGYSLAAIDDILERGTLAHWRELLDVVEGEPFGAVAEGILRICRAHHMYGTSSLWPATIAQIRRERTDRGAA